MLDFLATLRNSSRPDEMEAAIEAQFSAAISSLTEKDLEEMGLIE